MLRHFQVIPGTGLAQRICQVDRTPQFGGVVPPIRKNSRGAVSEDNSMSVLSVLLEPFIGT